MRINTRGRRRPDRRQGSKGQRMPGKSGCTPRCELKDREAPRSWLPSGSDAMPVRWKSSFVLSMSRSAAGRPSPAGSLAREQVGFDEIAAAS